MSVKRLHPVRFTFGFLIALAFLTYSEASKHKHPPPCPGGRFLVQGDALVAGDTAVSPEPVMLGGTQVSIGDVCSPTTASVKASKQGTKVKARWAGCTGLTGKVKLKATIGSDCSVMNGTLKAPKAKLTIPFVAQRSKCGDGVLDKAGGEQCDSGAGCSPSELCTEDCKCLPAIGTTTTNALPTSSTTNTPEASTTTTMEVAPSTTSSTILPNPAVCGDGIIETGEPCDTTAVPNGCPSGLPCVDNGGACACASQTANAVVGPAGGTISLPGYGGVVFPADALPSPQQVGITASSSPDVADNFAVSGGFFDAGPRLPFELTISTGNNQPSGDVTVIFNLPTGFATQLDPQSTIAGYALMLEIGEEDVLTHFNQVPSQLAPDGSQVSVTVPPEGFDDFNNGVVQAIVIVAIDSGSAPTSSLESAAATVCPAQGADPCGAQCAQLVGGLCPQNTCPFDSCGCQGDPLTSPLDGALGRVSCFKPQCPRFDGRKHKGHNGVDLRASSAPVYAVADGVIERPIQEDPGGGGWFIQIAHTGPFAGSARFASIYLHLTPNSFRNDLGQPLMKGDHVCAGERIATSGSSGGVPPHLHLGVIDRLTAGGKKYIDAFDCISQQCGAANKCPTGSQCPTADGTCSRGCDWDKTSSACQCADRCGNQRLDAGEECDASSSGGDALCPGKCIPPNHLNATGHPDECTCKPKKCVGGPSSGQLCITDIDCACAPGGLCTGEPACFGQGPGTPCSVVGGQGECCVVCPDSPALRCGVCYSSCTSGHCVQS
jgi:hypothetical protein